MRRAALCLLVLVGCRKDEPKPAPATLAPAPVVAPPAEPEAPLGPPPCAEPGCLPAFRTRTIDGARVTHQDLAGKVALVMFWASWCEPCTQEGPGLSQVFQARGPEGFALLGFSRDQVPEAELRRFRDRYRLTYPIAKLDEPTHAAFGAPPELPTFVLYGRDGRQLLRLTGALPADVLDREVGAALKAR